MSKLSKADKIRALILKKVPAAQIAKRVDVSINYVYYVVWADKKKAAKRQAKYIKREAVADRIKANTIPAIRARNAAKKAELSPIQQAAEDAAGTGFYEEVDHPPHYTYGGIETIDFIEAKNLNTNHNLATAVSYISRAPFKGSMLKDVRKAQWYLDREAKRLEREAEQRRAL